MFLASLYDSGMFSKLPGKLPGFAKATHPWGHVFDVQSIKETLPDVCVP